MGKVVKGIVLGGAVGAGYAAAQALRKEEPTDVVVERAVKTGAEAAAFGGLIGFVMARRGRKKARKASVVEALRSREFSEAVAAARPAVEHALELARDRATRAAEAAKPHVEHAAELARERAALAAEAAKPHVEEAGRKARKRAAKAADAARPYAERAADAARQRLAEGIEVGDSSIVVKVA